MWSVIWSTTNSVPLPSGLMPLCCLLLEGQPRSAGLEVRVRMRAVRFLALNEKIYLYWLIPGMLIKYWSCLEKNYLALKNSIMSVYYYNDNTNDNFSYHLIFMPRITVLPLLQMLPDLFKTCIYDA